MVWKATDPQGQEAQKVKYEIVKYTRGKVLDLGCGPWKTYPHFIGMDNKTEWTGHEYQPDIVGDCTNLTLFASKSMDAVFSSHFLEHVENPLKVLKEWWRVIKPGGHLILYLPHMNFYPCIGSEGANTDHKFDFLPRDIISEMKGVGYWDLIVCEERNEDQEYSFLQVFQKSEKNVPEKYLYSWAKEKPEKTCGIVRYGGFGDMIQTASILPGLKRQGYHITVYTTPGGHDILKSDPNIDEFFLQDNDQVPNMELLQFWDVQKQKFDKWVNLSESIEGTLLALECRPAYYWTKDARNMLLDVNYLDFMHMLAGVPDPVCPKFYPTEREARIARNRRDKINGPVIMWAADGSGVHKHWPHMDQAISRILITYPEAHIVMVGNELSSILEQGWQNEERVIKKCGKWDIRETLAFAETCNIVIGPETGILNSVSMLDIPKIVFLSHSTIKNLTRDWKNCKSLVPEGCECYPCHKMHYNFRTCSRVDDGAECQDKIDIVQFWEAFTLIIREGSDA